MPRPVRQFEPLWFDHQFRRDFKRLPEPEQRRRLEELAALAEALAICANPLLDPYLARFKPSAYHVPGVSSAKPLCEYRCAFPMRVIARWTPPCEEFPEGMVLLVAAPLSHDHRRLKEIIGRNKADL